MRIFQRIMKLLDRVGLLHYAVRSTWDAPHHRGITFWPYHSSGGGMFTINLDQWFFRIELTDEYRLALGPFFVEEHPPRNFLIRIGDRGIVLVHDKWAP